MNCLLPPSLSDNAFGADYTWGDAQVVGQFRVSVFLASQPAQGGFAVKKNEGEGSASHPPTPIGGAAKLPSVGL